MWQMFCPWISGADIAPLQLQPVPVRRRRLKSLLVAASLVGLMAAGTSPADAAADRKDDRIILAALNNTVPSDRSDVVPDLFGASETRYTDIRPFTKWTGVLARFKQDFAKSLNQREVQDWMHEIARLKDASNEEKITAVNDFFNQVPFVADIKNYGVRDRWATPMQFLARGGDCEDYAVAKYITLRALGFSENQLRLAIVYDRVMRMPHALLTVLNEGKTEILDNQNPAVMQSADITRYKPIYSISQVAWWRH